LVLSPIDDAGSDSFRNQCGWFPHPIDGALDGIGKTKQDGLDDFLAGVFQDILFDLNGQCFASGLSTLMVSQEVFRRHGEVQSAVPAR
jgi:hypothetical protein